MLLRILGFCWSRWRPFLRCSSINRLSVRLGGCSATPIAPRPAQPRPPRGAGLTSSDVHLTAQLLTVSADTVYALLPQGDLPGRTVGRKWLTTKTAVLKGLRAVRHATPRRPCRRPAWRMRLPRGIRPRWRRPSVGGKRGSGRRSPSAARSGRVSGRGQGLGRRQWCLEH